MLKNPSPDFEMSLSAKKRAAFRTGLLKFYDKHKRDLPWRKTSDPYAILVSEIMLQQTQVATIISRWAQFLEQFPTASSLADVSEERVCEAWAGLGYYRRARNLHKAATQIVEHHAGQFPQAFEDILGLAGVGRYTAGAVASIAFGQEVPVVDGNVIRVLARYFAVDRPKDDKELHKQAWELMALLVAGERPGDFNQAMMELGATLCSPAQPACSHCPLRRSCQAFRLGTQRAFPRPKPPKAREVLHVAFGILKTDEGFALNQRPLDGLWAGLWEPPSAQGASAAEAKALLEESYFRGATLTYYCEVRHILTHREVLARVYEINGITKLGGKPRFATELTSLGLSRLAAKVFEAWQEPSQRELFG